MSGEDSRIMQTGVQTGFRTGDILTISCPFTAAQVSEVTRSYVMIKWPWHRVDPDTPQFRWNGDVAVTSDPARFDWKRELFRTDPAPQHLKAGADCRVGIPLTVVHVIDIAKFNPPQETGMLPRPRVLLTLLPSGRSQIPDFEDQGCSIDPDDDIPIDIDVLFRPYAFLELGDEVADHDGRAWRFDGPWRWHPFDGGTETAPAWPLTLLTRHGESDQIAAAEVAEATSTGSHAYVIAQWERLADATPLSTS